MPDIIAAKSATPTSVFLRWKIDRPNGVIKYYQVSYYPVGHQARKKVFNTTHTNVTINGLKGGQEYVFQVNMNALIRREYANKDGIVFESAKASILNMEIFRPTWKREVF